MIRHRLSLVLAGAAVVGALAVPAASAVETPKVSVPTSTWACVGVQQVDLGVCLNNPFPQ